jgi:hypothetical protein
LGIGNVDWHGNGFNVEISADARCRFLERLRPASHDNEIVSGGRESPRQRVADTFRGTGDYHHRLEALIGGECRPIRSPSPTAPSLK